MPNYEKLIEKAIVENIVEPDSRKETLEAVFQPNTPLLPATLFSFLQKNITLAPQGMGVHLRESKYSISQLLEKEGFDYFICKSFVEDFENKILKQYNEDQKEKDTNKD